MQKEGRKAAIAAYRDRKVESGVYAVRCVPSGQVWVGSAPDLSTIQNRLWFTLRQGSNTHRTLQAAWAEHGADAFTFEVVERLPDDDNPGHDRAAALKRAHTHWLAKLDGTRI